MKRILCFSFSIVFLFINCFCGYAANTEEELKIYSTRDPYSDDYYDDEGNMLVFDVPKRKMAKSAAGANVLPAAYDSRDYNIVPPVRSQGSTGVCWAFATIASLEIDSIKNGYTYMEDTDFSESHLVWFTYSGSKDAEDPLYGEYYNTNLPYDLGGNWQRSSGTLSKWSGPANEKSFPFNSSDLNSMMNYSEDDRYNTSSGVIMKDALVFENANDVKAWIMEHGSCTASMFYSSSYENGLSSSYYCNVGGKGVNHMICVVGWDDDYSKDEFLISPPSDGAWLIRDSWGTGNHDNGYFWISYYDASIQSFCGFSSMPENKYDYNYTYNGVGATATAKVSSCSSIANVFTSNSNEILSAVSLSTVSANTSLEIKIYTDITNNNPVSGTLACSFTESVPNRGCHTFDLSKTVNLKKGIKFSIVVTFSVPGSNEVTIPVEYKNGTCVDKSKYDSSTDEYSIDETYYTSKSGESYCNIPDYTSGWVDSSAKEIGNFYIQAFTVCGHKNTYVEKEDGPCDAVHKCTEICSDCGRTVRTYSEGGSNHDLTNWSDLGNGSFETHCRKCDYSKTVKARINIRNNINGTNDKVGYREGIKLTAQYELLPPGYSVAWYVGNSSVPYCYGDNFTATDLREDLTVSVKMLNSSGNPVKSENGKEVSDSETLLIKNGFFNKLIAFFRFLFKSPAIIEQ